MMKVYKILIPVLALPLFWQTYPPVRQASALSLPPADSIILTVSPASPRAGDNVTVNAKSFSFDTARAKFNWFLDGREVASGVGLVEYSFVSGRLGSETSIRVTATSADGGFYAASVGMGVADIDFIVNPLTYTPNFYRGAAMPTPGSVVEVIAVPHLFRNGVKLKAPNLIYEWSLDNKALSAQSGGGKNKLALRLADVGSGDYAVALRVSSPDNSIVAQKNTRIKTASPEILFYAANPLTGPARRAATFFAGRPGDRFSLLAEPFFFGADSLARAKFNWKANGKVIAETAKNPKLLDLTAPANTESQTLFSLLIEDKKNIFQRAESALNIIISQ